MGKKFGVNVTVTGKNGQTETFAPGDDVPSWAEGHFGDHCLALQLDAVDDDHLDSLPVSDLREIAEDRGVNLTSNKKSEIIDELKAAGSPSV